MIAERRPSTPNSSNIRNRRAASEADLHGALALLKNHSSTRIPLIHSDGSAALRTPSTLCQIA